MSSVPDAAETAPAQTRSQLKAALWSDDASQVHAVVMGSRVPDLQARLEAAEIADHECLVPGALSPEAERSAPYMVPLARDAAFTDWVLFEAAAGLGDWGSLVLSAAPRIMLRNHLRSLGEASLPGGQTIDLAWMDPEIAQAILPLCDPVALAAFMGPLQAIVLPRATGWTRLDVEHGRLRVRSVRIMPSG